MTEIFAYAKGFATMIALIIAIGVQNAFVLQQGIKHEHTFLVAAVCSLCDAALIVLGAVGLGALITNNLTLNLIIGWGGAAFLFVYALRSFFAAYRATGLKVGSARRGSRNNVMVKALAVSLLNPHAILDTVVLVGGLAARYEGAARTACAVGGMTASFLWFFGLAYGARWLAPVLSRPSVWRVVDIVIGLMMLSLAVSLALDGWTLLQGSN